MTSITTRVHVATDGTRTGRVPSGVPAGEYDAVISVEGIRQPFDVTYLPTIDLGPWPVDVARRLADMYSGDGR